MLCYEYVKLCCVVLCYVMFMLFYVMLTRQRLHVDPDDYRALIGSRSLSVKCNHLPAASTIGSARNRLWYLLTSALDIMAMRL